MKDFLTQPHSSNYKHPLVSSRLVIIIYPTPSNQYLPFALGVLSEIQERSEWTRHNTNSKFHLVPESVLCVCMWVQLFQFSSRCRRLLGFWVSNLRDIDCERDGVL